MVFCGAYTSLHYKSTQQYLFLHIFTGVLLSLVFFMTAILIGVSWYSLLFWFAFPRLWFLITFSCACWPFIYFLRNKMSFQFLHQFLNCVGFLGGCYWVVWILCNFGYNWAANIFLQFWRLRFHFDSFLCCAKAFKFVVLLAYFCFWYQIEEFVAKTSVKEIMMLCVIS